MAEEETTASDAEFDSLRNQLLNILKQVRAACGHMKERLKAVDDILASEASKRSEAGKAKPVESEAKPAAHVMRGSGTTKAARQKTYRKVAKPVARHR